MKSILLPVILFVLSMTITPGPNNMLLTATGARFGYRKALPLVAGIVLGLLSLLIMSALGLGILFQKYPLIKQGLKVTGTLYILYLAFIIAFKKGEGSREEKAEKPLNILQGAAFQYMNPKAYIMCITAMSVFPLTGSEYLPSALFIIGCFLVITPFSVSVWAYFGTVLNRIFPPGGSRRKMDYFLGGLTAASALFIIL